MIESAAKVIDLLSYIEQIEKLKRKPTFSLPDEFFVAHRHELLNLPELQFNLQQGSDDVWLKLPRLQEVAPPELDDLLKPWVPLGTYLMTTKMSWGGTSTVFRVFPEFRYLAFC